MELHLETNSLLGCQKEHCWDRNFHLVIQMETCLEFHLEMQKGSTMGQNWGMH